MQTLNVKAHLSSGFISSDPWSPALDGIIAYQHMREKLGPEQFAMSQHRTDMMSVVDDLPLAKEEYGGQWWYACSSPIYKSHLERTVHLHRRFSAQRAERFWTDEGKSGKVLVAAGPYKNARLPFIHHITGVVEWNVVGNFAEVSRLLHRVTHIGGRTGAGFGKVIRWEINQGGDEDLARNHRPLPVEYAKNDGRVMIWGLRPPVRHPDNRVECVMP